MTRLERELSGQHGEYWRKDALKRIAKMEQDVLDGKVFFGADGVVRWKSNDRVIPSDYREVLAHTAYRDLFDEEASVQADREDTRKILEEYRKNMENHTYSDEEMFEMRSAFGEGTEVVNVITGRVVRL